MATRRVYKPQADVSDVPDLPLADELYLLILKYRDCPGIVSDLEVALARLGDRPSPESAETAPSRTDRLHHREI